MQFHGPVEWLLHGPTLLRAEPATASPIEQSREPEIVTGKKPHYSFAEIARGIHEVHPLPTVMGEVIEEEEEIAQNEDVKHAELSEQQWVTVERKTRVKTAQKQQGKLIAVAKSTFCRAYGLNGFKRVKHGELIRQIMDETGCSRRSMCMLLYG
jgi:hypothetical protein